MTGSILKGRLFTISNRMPYDGTFLQQLGTED